MAGYAFLDVPLTCASCSTPIANQIWFQWGYCRGQAQDAESTYRIGDTIRWHTCADGETPSWTQLLRAGRDAGMNIGAPKVQDLIVRDFAQTWLRDACPNCGAALGGGAVEIDGGIIVRGWLTLRSELPDTEYLLRSPDGLWIPSGWPADHPVAIRDDC